MKRQRLPISNPKPNPISKKKKKSEPHTLQPDSVIISSLERLRSQCSSSSSETHFEFDAASISELDRIFLRDKDQFQSDDDVLDDDVFVSPFGGLVSGRIIITNAKNDYSIDCSKLLDNGITISPNPSYFGSFESDAIFILLVDDGDVFMQLLGDRFSNRFPSIIIWAEGQRHRATRDFLKRLKIQFKLPVFALLNSDPHGLQILSFYKCGSLDIKWLGLRPSDLDKHQISQYCRRPMTDQDVKTGNDLLKKDFVKSNKGWVMELEMMVKTRQKAEVLSLSSLGFQYLTEVYLPLKLQQQDWL